MWHQSFPILYVAFFKELDTCFKEWFRLQYVVHIKKQQNLSCHFTLVRQLKRVTVITF